MKSLPTNEKLHIVPGSGTLVATYSDDNGKFHTYDKYPIVAWQIQEYTRDDELFTHPAEPITVMQFCSNEKTGILMDDGRVIVPWCLEHKSPEDWIAHLNGDEDKSGTQPKAA